MRLIFLLLVSFTAHAEGKLKVLTTFPDLAEVARDIGGDKIQADSLLSGSEDAHFLDAVPSFIRKAADADVVCILGLDIEIGWMPKILSKTGKAAIQPGGPGYCDVGRGVNAIEKPVGPIDRSMGDVHPLGNPHYNLSPLHLADAAKIIAGALTLARPEHAAEFQAGLDRFRARMTALHKEIGAKLQKGPLLIEYHREFTYFFNAYGLQSAGAIEEKPGVPPSAARLAEVASAAKARKVRLALAATYSPEKHIKKFSELSGVPYKRLPTMVSKTDPNFNSIEKVQNAIADAIIKDL